MREKPEPFYCAFRNTDTYYPFNTLQAHMCERQCIKCECIQEGTNEFNPRHLPMIQYEVDFTEWRVWMWRLWDEDYLYIRSWSKFNPPGWQEVDGVQLPPINWADDRFLP